MKKNIENAKVSILLEIDGKIHIVGMEKEKIKAISFLIKTATDVTIQTNKTRKDLHKFLGYSEEFPI